ncbi:MAG: transcriptional repressor LexA [Angelakisella sp.]|jgi:repressor LexA|nr:transcriptional repressor LexA [Angelakisella sp.]
MADMNPKALQILDYIRDRIDEGLPPSVREICAALDIKSTSTAHKYLGELRERGLIEKGDRLNRAITLPDDRSVRVPLVGTVTAGQPILAVEEIEGYIPYRSRHLHSRDLFALRVRGESMINAGILDGDIVVVRRTPTAENGDIVVALVEDEATVKRFYKEKGHFRLQPENDEMEPIIVDSVSILGRVISLIREYEGI